MINEALLMKNIKNARIKIKMKNNTLRTTDKEQRTTDNERKDHEYDQDYD